MKHLASLALLLALFVIVQSLGFAQVSAPSQGPVGGTSTPELDPAAWKRYTSAAGGYSALFPGTPVEETKPAPSPAQDLAMHMATVRTMAEYAVCYTDFPAPIEGTDKVAMFLAGVRDGGVKAINGRPIDDKEVAYRGHPGRVYQIEFGGGYVLTNRAFVIKNRLYLVTATAYGEKKAPPDVVQLYAAAGRRFLDSFMLTSEEEEKKDVGNRDPVSTPSPLPETTEGEVTRMMKQLAAAGESVLTLCADKKHCDPVKGVDGRVITGGVVAGKTVSKPQPAYPPIARAARASGTVVVALIVDESGKVIAAQAISGHPLLQAASVQAARDWQFTPTLLDGKPVKVTGTITFTFNLQ